MVYSKNTKPQLTISLLVSNRLDTIRRCLDSLRPIMEALPSELILVDTSKNPVVHEILLEYTNQVYEFEWCKDFAKARNVGLGKAKGEWFLFLDDDEWFVETEELIRFFKSGEYRAYGYANYQVRNFFDINYLSYSDGWVSRLIRIDSDTRFVGKIHEMFAPLRGKRKDIDAMVYHSGYIYETEEKKRAHFERNATLLLDMIEEEPENMRWHMQLMQEYGSVQEWDNLIDCCRKAIEILGGEDGQTVNLQRSSFYAGYVYALLRKGEHRRCIEASNEVLEDSRSVDVLRALVYLRMAESYFALEKWCEAEGYAKRYIDESFRLVNKGQTVVKKNTVPYLGETFEDKRMKNAYSILICCDLKRGSVEALKNYYEKLEWNQANVYASANIEKFLMEAMGTMEFHPIFSEVISDAYRNRGLRRYMNLELKKYESSDEAMKKILYAYSEAEGNDAAIWCARACKADWENDADMVMQSLRQYFSHVENAFDIPERLKNVANKQKENVYEYWSLVEADRWKASIYQLVERSEIDEIRSFLKEVKDVFGENHWRYLYMFMFLLKKEDRIEEWVNATFDFYALYVKEGWAEEDEEQRVLYRRKLDVEEGIVRDITAVGYDELVQMLHEFMIVELEYGLSIYREEAFEGDLEMLSPEVRSAVWLNEFFGREKQDFEGRIVMLRECAKAWVQLGTSIKRLAKFIGEQQMEYEQKQSKCANDELSQMLVIMKDKIHGMVEQGMKQEALAILVQVLALAPEDKELIAMQNELQEKGL